jgi:hypothetical protein
VLLASVVSSAEEPVDPEWEILNLLREVRRRARASSGAYLARLQVEPRWVSALPEAEARIARTMLEATREMALRAVDPDPFGELTANAEARPRKPARRRSR